MNKPIVGYLIHSGGFVCPDCYHEELYCPEASPVWLTNILPYKQSCHHCGRLVIEGRTHAWPELFDDKREKKSLHPKSDMLREMAREQGIPVVDVGMAFVEPSDIKGMPFPEQFTTRDIGGLPLPEDTRAQRTQYQELAALASKRLEEYIDANLGKPECSQTIDQIVEMIEPYFGKHPPAQVLQRSLDIINGKYTGDLES